MPHDFQQFPELTNKQMEIYYFDSPHKQITEDIRVRVIRVIDGDTISVEWSERDFVFPVRFARINAKELSEGGKEIKEWLAELIEGTEVEIIINRNNRVGKYGRLLGKIISRGMDVGEWMLREGRVTTFDNKDEGKIPDINKLTGLKQWF